MFSPYHRCNVHGTKSGFLVFWSPEEAISATAISLSIEPPVQEVGGGSSGRNGWGLAHTAGQQGPITAGNLGEVAGWSAPGKSQAPSSNDSCRWQHQR